MKLKQVEDEISECYTEDFYIEQFETFDTIIKAIVLNYIERFKNRFDYYLNSFSRLEINDSFIHDAVHGFYKDSKGIVQRWFHQVIFVKYQGTEPLDLLTSRLVTLKDKIKTCEDFDTLYNIVEAVSEPIDNSGKLTCYDISLGIGMALDLHPHH